MEMKFNHKHLVAKVLFALGLGMYAAIPSAYALPSMGTLDNSRAATVTVDGKQMTIEGKGANNVINWASFGIDKGETVKFNDKNNYLNMVYGVDISRIYGTISGGNIIYLVNPNGILFAEGSRLDNVGSFVASTRNLSSIDKSVFLKEPGNAEGVLGKDNEDEDNKYRYDTLLEEGTYRRAVYRPKITVADIQLTNVPESATQIFLDGPNGVILKNTDILDKMKAVITRRKEGNLGIGSLNGDVSLTEEQKNKVFLINDGILYGYTPYVLRSYRIIKDFDDFMSINFDKSSDFNYEDRNHAYFMLGEDMDASLVKQYKPKGFYYGPKGCFEGLGYTISNLQISDYKTEGNEYADSLGLFSKFLGDLRNLNLENINVDSKYAYTVGGLIGNWRGGSMSNVSVSGNIKGPEMVGGIIGVYDPVTVDLKNGGYKYSQEIRNVHNSAQVIGVNGYEYGFEPSSYWERDVGVGGIIGCMKRTYAWAPDMLHMYNVHNSGNITSFNYKLEKPDYLTGWKWSTELSAAGIIGNARHSSGTLMKGVYNTGSVNLVPVVKDIDTVKNIYASGIIGNGYYMYIGDTYNLGEINIEEVGENCHLYFGGIWAGKYEASDELYALDGKEKLKSYYITEKLLNSKKSEGEEFGIGILEEEMNRIFNKDMLGFVLYPKPGGDSSGTSNGNTGGSTGDNTGGNTGGESGGGIGENPGEVTKPDGGHVWNEKGYQDDMVFVNQVNKVIQNGTGKILEQSNGKITYEKNNGHKETKNGKTKEDYENFVERAIIKMQGRNEKKSADKEKTLAKLKGIISATPTWWFMNAKSDDFTDDAYQAFFDFLSERLADGDSTSLTKDDFASGEAIANILQNAVGQVNGTKVVNGVEYTFSSIEFKQQNNCAFNVDMKWTEKNGKQKGYTLTFTNVLTKEAKNALVDYVDNLADYGKDVTAKATSEVVQAITGSNIAGVVTKDALINALSSDKKAKDFAKACGKDVENYIKGAPKEKLKQLISDNVAGGKEVVNAIENLLSIQK